MSDHLTHRRGVDADLYLLDFPVGEDGTSDLSRPLQLWSTWQEGQGVWSTEPEGEGIVEDVEVDGQTRTGRRLDLLAGLAMPRDDIMFFVHNDVRVLEPYDSQARARREGRRYLHDENRAYWPPHRDHVHLRWGDPTWEVVHPPRP